MGFHRPARAMGRSFFSSQVHCGAPCIAVRCCTAFVPSAHLTALNTAFLTDIAHRCLRLVRSPAGENEPSAGPEGVPPGIGATAGGRGGGGSGRFVRANHLLNFQSYNASGTGAGGRGGAGSGRGRGGAGYRPSYRPPRALKYDREKFLQVRRSRAWASRYSPYRELTEPQSAPVALRPFCLMPCAVRRRQTPFFARFAYAHQPGLFISLRCRPTSVSWCQTLWTWHAAAPLTRPTSPSTGTTCCRRADACCNHA